MARPVSVVIPVFNGERYLEKAVHSAHAAGVEEILVIDDGSTDRTPNILLAMQSQIPTIRVLSQKNRGESAALNRGLGACTQPFVIFLSADDIIYSDGVTSQLEAHEANPSLVATYPNWQMIDDEGKEISMVETKDFSQLKLVGDLECLPGPGSMIRVSAMRSLGYARKEGIRFWSDLDQWIRLAQIGPIERVEVTGAAWRLHEENATHAARGEALVGDLQLLRRSVEELEPPLPKVTWGRFLATWHRLMAIALVQSKPFSFAAIHATHSLVWLLRLPRGLRRSAWRLEEIAGAMFPPLGYWTSVIRKKTRSSVD